VLRDMALSVKGMAPGDIAFLTMPWLERGDGENVIVDEQGAAPLWQSIKDDVPWIKPKKPSSTGSGSTKVTVAPADITVRVLNGSGVAGRAAEVAAALEAQGFTIAEIGDADRSDYVGTEIRHDAPSAEAARTVLEALPGATAIADDASATITIVIGTSYSGVAAVDVGAATNNPDKDRENDAITDPTTADKVRCA